MKKPNLGLLVAILLSIFLQMAGVAATSKLKNNLTVTGNLAVTGTLTQTGAATFTVPLTVAAVNSAIDRHSQAGTIANGGTIADGATHRVVFHPGRAGTLKQVAVSAITPPIGGTSTVKFLKNNATAMTAADFDPTGLVANTLSKPALHATAANLAFTATDTIVAEWVSGTQTTDAVGAGVSIEYELTDF